MSMCSLVQEYLNQFPALVQVIGKMPHEVTLYRNTRGKPSMNPEDNRDIDGLVGIHWWIGYTRHVKEQINTHV